MFGKAKKQPSSDKLTVQVHVVASDAVFKLAQKIWDENARTMHLEPHTGKEFLHFGYTNPACVVWLQRDQGKAAPLELIIRWEASGTHEVYVLSAGQDGTGAALSRAQQLLNSMLTTPSVVLSN